MGYQGYVVDPKDKKQIATARDWATVYNQGEPVEFDFENEDFEFELFDRYL